MPEDDFEIDKILLTPISDMISTIGDSIVEAATSMNRHQVAAMQDYPNELIELGILPTFFHMQEVEVELKMALHVLETTEGTTEERKKKGWFSTPINSTYTNAAQFETSGSSSVRMTFAPSPPPPAMEPELPAPDPSRQTEFTKPDATETDNGES